jgi:hypothetical protein
MFSNAKVINPNHVAYCLFNLGTCINTYNTVPFPVTARSKAWVCGRSLAGIVGSNPTEKHGCLSVVSHVRCQVEVSALG